MFLTAFKTPQFISYLKQFGIEKCYEKPVEYEILAQIIESVSTEPNVLKQLPSKTENDLN